MDDKEIKRRVKRLIELGYVSKGTGSSFFAISDLRKVLRTELSPIRKALYQDYLKTEEWQKRRDNILRRDSGKCRLCGETAVHVHHLTYDRVYDEPLYDLISVCKKCHEYIHLLD